MKMNRRTFVKLGSISVASAPLFHLQQSLGAQQHTSLKSSSELYKLFKAPPPQARPFVRWWWNGNRVVKDELLRELDLLKAAGIGGVEINAIAFPDTADPMLYKPMDWASSEWTEMVQATVKGAKERGIICDIIVGSGWPFGGEFLTEAEQTQMLALGTRELKGGPKKYEISREELLKETEPPIMSKRANKKKELLFLRLAPAKMDKFEEGIVLDDQVSNETVSIEVPEGDHVLYFLVKLTGYQSVIHGAPGANGPVLNHLSKPAVEKYINKMSDALVPRIGELGGSFRSLFVDSMEVEGANWCDDMLEQFEKRRGYSVKAYLPYILFKTGRMGRPLPGEYGSKFSGNAQDTIDRVRYDFEITKVELFTERFLNTYIEWCKKHQVQSRVQAYGREFHPLDASLSLDITDCETWIRPHTGEPFKEDDFRYGRTYTPVNKFVSSAARLTGKRMVSCEELTNTQVVFNATLETLKVTADQSNLSGVTHSILHGFNYSPKDAPFPGWVRYGTFFNERNPWWPYFKAFTDYKARLSAVFQNADAFADIAVLHPLADQWSKYGAPWHPNPERAYPEYVFKVWEALHQSGYGCDYVSEHILQGSTAADGELSYGPRKYKVLMLVEVESMKPETAKALERFAAAGGQIVCVGKEPSRSPGFKDNERENAMVAKIISGIKQQHAGSMLAHPAPEPNASMLAWLKGLQPRLKTQPYLRVKEPVSSVSQVRYTTETADIVFLVNSNIQETCRMDVEVMTKHKTAWIWDPETGARYVYPTAGPGKTLQITLAPAESKLLVFDDEAPDGKTFVEPQIASEAKTVSGPWRVELEHVDGTKRLLILNELVDFKDRADLKSFAGVIRYEAGFDLSNLQASPYLSLGKVWGVSEATLNGKSLGTKWHGSHTYDISEAARSGRNVLKVKVTTTLGNYMKSLKDNKDPVKWMKNQALFPMGLIGPVKA